MLVLEGVVEVRRHTFYGAFVADPAVVVDPARQRFELAVAADDALEIGSRHGEYGVFGVFDVFVGGLSESVGSPRLIEVENGSCVTTDCVCRCRKREKREGVSRRCWGGDREEVRALDWPAV